MRLWEEKFLYSKNFFFTGHFFRGIKKEKRNSCVREHHPRCGIIPEGEEDEVVVVLGKGALLGLLPERRLILLRDKETLRQKSRSEIIDIIPSFFPQINHRALR